MDTSAFDQYQPTWQWPEDVSEPSESHAEASEQPPPFRRRAPTASASSQNASKKPRTRHYGPRTCRICLDTVLPTNNSPSVNLPSVLSPSPSVTYVSPAPDGRLISPCKCKGSSKYVHEGCLQSWRHADPRYGRRNYWQCPTCGFRYRLERMRWSRWISNSFTQIALTGFILLLAIFLLGFIADPIISLYLDPLSTITSPLTSGRFDPIPDPDLDLDQPASWTEHLLKGVASLGLLSFVKVLLAMSPWQWWNLRSSGVMGGGGRPGANGRERLGQISWVVVLIGLFTFLWGVYKGVRAWSRRTLEKAGERVVDIQMDGEEEDY